MSFRDKLKPKIRSILTFLGFEFRNWLRIMQIKAFEQFLRDHAQVGAVLEISPDWNSSWSEFCSSYSFVNYPEFDICKDVHPDKFDIVIADQVLEHVADPRAAIRNIHAMLKPGGYAMIATPFLFRVHARPHDYSRWTEAGLKALLEQNGFMPAHIYTSSWGNKSCARAHIGGKVKRYGFYRDLSNDPLYPMQVWAFARA